MSSASTDVPIGVGAVGLDPETDSGPLAEMPEGEYFELVALCDEGTEEQDVDYGELPCYSDYNILLRDEEVELVLVGGPLDTRRDFAVRALNAGCHVLIQEPFCETALDAERVMKTAFHNGLVATMNLEWRDDADLCALRAALAEENVGAIHTVQTFWSPPEGQAMPQALHFSRQ